MKLIILAFTVATSSFTSCNSNNSGKTESKASDTGKVTEQVTPDIQKDSASIQLVLTAYLELKNALVADKSNEAAEASKSLKAALDKMGNDLMTESQQKAFTNIGNASKEHADLISAGSNNIKQQREHFQMLSKNIYDLVKTFGTKQTLYKDYCPMVKAIWLSETKPIKNPYYGKEMLACGEVQETIK